MKCYVKDRNNNVVKADYSNNSILVVNTIIIYNSASHQGI
jgi:hypothetical protein